MDDQTQQLFDRAPDEPDAPIDANDTVDDADDAGEASGQYQTQTQADPETPTRGRVALVTGAATGLGKAIAMELARRGWSMFLQYDPDDVASLPASQQEPADAGHKFLHDAALAGGHTIEVESAIANLADFDGREQLVEQVLEALGRIDMLVNASCASPLRAGEDLLEMTEGPYRDVLEQVLSATLFLTQRVANEMVRMVEAGLIENPKIVTINTLAAYATSTDNAAQCIARSGLEMMTRLFADRLGELGINTYEVRTGIIATASGDAGHARYDELISQGLTPIRRWGRPGDVARAVAAIAEDLLGFSTGDVINVDGGFHLRRL